MNDEFFTKNKAAPREGSNAFTQTAAEKCPASISRYVFSSRHQPFTYTGGGLLQASESLAATAFPLPAEKNF